MKGGMLRMRSLLLRLRPKRNFRDDYLRIPWDPLCQRDLLGWSYAVQQRQGGDNSLPMPDWSSCREASNIGWGAIMGEQQVSGVCTPSQKQGSITLRQMMAICIELLAFQQAPQRQNDRPVLRQCHNSRVSQAIGRHKVRDPVPQSKGDPPGGQIMQTTTLLQFIQGSLDTRADLLSRPILGIGSEWTLHQQVVQDLLHQWPAIIDIFPASLTARLPVFFAPAWESKAKE